MRSCVPRDASYTQTSVPFSANTVIAIRLGSVGETLAALKTGAGALSGCSTPLRSTHVSDAVGRPVAPGTYASVPDCEIASSGNGDPENPLTPFNTATGLPRVSRRLASNGTAMSDPVAETKYARYASVGPEPAGTNCAICAFFNTTVRVRFRRSSATI